MRPDAHWPAKRVNRPVRNPVDVPADKMDGLFDSLWLYTMNRCHSLRARLALAAFLSLGLVGAAAPSLALAQESIRREAPKDVVLGRMTVVAPPVIQMDGKDDRLSPGVRIRDARNMLVLSGSLAGTTVPVVYRRDMTGLVHEVWLLTADEYGKLGGAGGDAQKLASLLAAIFGARQ